MQLLWLVWSIRSIIDRFNRFYSYLYTKNHIPYEERYLQVGQLVSRIAKGESFNLYGIIHCQHFGVVVDIDDDPLILHITKSKGVHLSSISEYMDGERILHIYHNNPYPDLSNIEGISYSLLMSNCEHLATRIVDGVPRSRQLEVLEYISTSDGDPPEDMRLVPNMSLYI